MRLSNLTWVALFAVSSGCGSTMPPLLGDGDSTPYVTIIHSGACTVEGQTVACQVITGQSGSVVNCFHGVQTCTNGQWGLCAEPSDSGEASDAASDSGDAGSADDSGDASD